MGRPILSPGKKLTGGKFRPVTDEAAFYINLAGCVSLRYNMVNVVKFRTQVASARKTWTNSADPDQTASEEVV